MTMTGRRVMSSLFGRVIGFGCLRRMAMIGGRVS